MPAWAPLSSGCAAPLVPAHARPASDGAVSGRRSTRRRRRPPLRKVRAPATFDAALRFLADHPDPAAVVECTLPDGSQGWVPASVAALVEAMPPENAARLRRLLGELLPDAMGGGDAAPR